MNSSCIHKIARNSIAMGTAKNKLSSAITTGARRNPATGDKVLRVFLNGKQNRLVLHQPSCSTPTTSNFQQDTARRSLSTLSSSGAHQRTTSSSSRSDDHHEEQVAFWKRRFASIMARNMKNNNVNLTQPSITPQTVLSPYWKREIASFIERKSANASLAAAVCRNNNSILEQQTYQASSSTTPYKPNSTILSPYWKREIANYISRQKANASLAASVGMVSTRSMTTYAAAAAASPRARLVVDDENNIDYCYDQRKSVLSSDWYRKFASFLLRKAANTSLISESVAHSPSSQQQQQQQQQGNSCESSKTVGSRTFPSPTIPRKQKKSTTTTQHDVITGFLAGPVTMQKRTV